MYKGADVFMICVAVNLKESFYNIEKWREEIEASEIGKPIMLLLTKCDIEDKAVTGKDLKSHRSKHKCYSGVLETSSRDWEWNNYNVIKAFKNTLRKGYVVKYE